MSLLQPGLLIAGGFTLALGILHFFFPVRLDFERAIPREGAATIRRNSMVAAAGLTLEGELRLLHFVRRLDVAVWSLAQVAANRVGHAEGARN